MRTRFRVETIRVSRKESKTLLVLQVHSKTCSRRYPDAPCLPGLEPCMDCGVWRDARVEDFTTTPVIEQPPPKHP